MRGSYVVRAGLIGAVLVSGNLFALQNLVSASSVPQSIASQQKQLERQLADWAALLGRFGADVTNSSTLTLAHSLVLDARSTGPVEMLDGLVAKVPTDKTQSQLDAAKAVMVELNQVFAVLTPQVFETIEADAISSEVSSLKSDEQPLRSLVNSIAGQSGYEIAHVRYLTLVKSVSLAKHDANGVATAVLAQKTANFPDDANIFLHANQELSNASDALVNATYAESMIGLAIGGYTSS